MPELDDALDTAQSCYRNDWRHRPIADRARIVRAAAAGLRANAAEYAQYVTLEMGKLIGTAEAEVGLSAAILDYYADQAEAFLAATGTARVAGGGGRNRARSG